MKEKTMTTETIKDWEKEFTDTFHIYNLKTGTPAGAEKEAIAFIRTLLTQAQQEERERCLDVAWTYMVEATRKESWSKEELKDALTPRE